MVSALFMISGLFISVSMLLAVLQFIRSKEIVTYAVAFDILSILSISLIVMIAHFAARAIYIDVAIVYGLLSFLGILVVARYIEKGL